MLQRADKVQVALHSIVLKERSIQVNFALLDRLMHAREVHLGEELLSFILDRLIVALNTFELKSIDNCQIVLVRH